MHFDWNTVASFATALGVGVAAWQIWEGRKLSQTTFEDSLDQQYRNLVKEIPVDVLLGKPVQDNKKNETREIIYNYLDLCNEQAFLRKKKRISKERWIEWNEGIKENIEKPGFKEVWDEVKKEAPSTFSSLNQLERSNFKIDPIEFNKILHNQSLNADSGNSPAAG